MSAPLSYRERLHEELRQHFDDRFRRALTVFDGDAPGTRFALVQSASYLFNTSGYRWGMDLAFRDTYQLAETPVQSADLLCRADLMLISHGHADHFEERTVRALAETGLQWVIPDFLADRAAAWGIAPDRLHLAREGEPMRIRPVSGRGVPEYGYHITAPGSPALVFPVDVRDFALDGLPALPAADYCFANVWLGDKAALSTDLAAPCDRLARFALRLCPKHILLTHLYESGRADDVMWREEHAAMVADAIRALSPETRVTIPYSGEIIALD